MTADHSPRPAPDTGHIDLSRMPYMPLDIDRFVRSKLANSGLNPYAIHTLALCCNAFRNTPAGSVPNDDLDLMTQSCFHGSLEDFLKIKHHILYGFHLCEDGLLYHDYVARKAIEVWETNHKRTEKANEARRRKIEEENSRKLAEAERRPAASPQDARPVQAATGYTLTPLVASASLYAGLAGVQASGTAQERANHTQQEASRDVDVTLPRNRTELNLKNQESPPYTPPLGGNAGDLFGGDKVPPAVPADLRQPTGPDREEPTGHAPPPDTGPDPMDLLFQAFRDAYPPRMGNMDWKLARTHWDRQIRMGTDPARMIHAADCYFRNMKDDRKVSDRSVRPGPGFIRSELVMQPTRFLNPKNGEIDAAIEDREQRDLIRASGSNVERLPVNRQDGGRPYGQRNAPQPAPRRRRPSA